MKRFFLRTPLVILKMMFLFCGTALIITIMAISGTLLYLEPRLPPIDSLRDIRLQVPLRILSRDDKLIAEFGEFRRIPTTFDQIPQRMVQAFLAAEDDRFFSHPGVDYQGILRAGLHVLKTGSKGQGGSTITMQVARNFFLSSEKTYLRKANEILLSFKIEKELSKEEILALYLNRIFLGQRAYGIGAAAQVYYGKSLDALELHEIAMIAGLPKAPSTMNPIANPQRARIRRDYVLGRMLELGFINAEEHTAASAMSAETKLHFLQAEVQAPHFAELIRHEAHSLLGEEAYTHGYIIRTSLDSKLQAIANRAFNAALIDYDRRHGYRGPEARHPLSDAPTPGQLEALLAGVATVQQMQPGIVIATDTTTNSAEVYIGNRKTIRLEFTSMNWARKHLSPNALGPRITSVKDVLAPGDQIRVTYSAESDSWALTQIPAVDGALIAQDPLSGDILALVGGFDFNSSKFNRAAQALRQPGSSFKPFLYALAIDSGFTAASIINDAPVVFDDPGLESSWRPENYSGRFYGPTRLREALAQSRNLVSIRLLQAMSLRKTLDGLTRFGFERAQLPADLSLSLGSNNLTPLQLSAAYSVFANGGYRVPVNTTLELVDAAAATTLWKRPPVGLAETCPEPAGNAWSLADYVRSGAAGSATPAASDPVLTNDTSAAGVAGVDVALSDEAAYNDAAGTERHDEAEGSATATAQGDATQADGLTTIETVCVPRVLSAQTTYIANSLLQDVIRTGTARRALSLGRSDLAGKTGTTNDVKDAWFVGFTPRLVATAWIGFDQATTLGSNETGGRSALPMWIDFMREALADTDQVPFERPPGIVSIRINRQTGVTTSSQDPDGMVEYFIDGHLPPSMPTGYFPGGDNNTPGGSGGAGGTPEEPIF